MEIATTEEFDQSLAWVFRLFKDRECYHPIGTCFLLSENHVVTCEHVWKNRLGDLVYLQPKDPTGARLQDAKHVSTAKIAAIELRHLKSDCKLDLAILSLGKGIEDLASVPKLVEGITDEVYRGILAGNSGCFGGLSRTWESLEQIYRFGVNEIEFSGGPRAGFSGSPVLLKEFPVSGIFGMMLKGGLDSGHSLAITSQKIIEFARATNEVDLRSINLIDMLQHIAFGKNVLSSSVTNDWYSKWDYAKNTDGVYVDVNGYELTDSLGNKLVNHDRDRNLLVANGVNTGSPEYANMFEGILKPK
ncbi:MAG: S1 family peptidase [Pirellula sp.]